MSATAPTSDLKFLLTTRCNIRCNFCHNEFQGDGSLTANRPYGPTRLAHLLASLFEARPFGDLKISGGEPLVATENLRCVIAATRRYKFNRRIVVTNLLAATDATLRFLRASDIQELRVNVPAFRAADYASITGTSEKTFVRLVRILEAAKRLGFLLRANVVVSDTYKVNAAEVFRGGSLSLSPFDALFDEVFFIVDFRSRNKTALEQEVLAQLDKQLGLPTGSRKGRITEYRGRSFKISVAQCTVADERGPQDIYIVPPGKVLSTFSAGYAYG